MITLIRKMIRAINDSYEAELQFMASLSDHERAYLSKIRAMNDLG